MAVQSEPPSILVLYFVHDNLYRHGDEPPDEGFQPPGTHRGEFNGQHSVHDGAGEDVHMQAELRNDGQVSAKHRDRLHGRGVR